MTAPALELGVRGAVERIIDRGDGSTLRYVVAGQTGPTIVCVNALAQGLRMFSRVAEQLSQTHRVVAWRCREADEGREHPTMIDHVSDLGAIVEHERISECALLSWCSGAKIALEFSCHEPRVVGLVLANGTYKTIPGFERLETSFEKTLLDLCQTVLRNPHLAPVMQSAMHTLLTGNAGGAMAKAACRDDAALGAMIVEPFASPQATLRYAAQVVDYMSHDIGAKLEQMTVPVMVVSGADDRISAPAMSAAIARRMARGHLVEVPSATHYCLYDQASELLPTVAGFLGSVLPGSS